jgi:cellulose synthase/poly-beta-1,6-N-acetylglucosamine synthase-like glycosyltransferase
MSLAATLLSGDQAAVWLADLWASMRWEIARRESSDWVLCFAPILIFLEIPRYYLPPLVLALLRLLRHRRLERRPTVACRRLPSATLVVAGRNEEEAIARCLRSVLDQDHPDFEVIVVDDASDDRTWEIARRFAAEGRMRVLRNDALRGRTGKPSAVNLALSFARGDVLVSVDADTTLARDALRKIVEPFVDPRVGCVAGNVMVRKDERGLVTRLQELEYAVSIDLHKRWTDLQGCTLQASGAFNAVRTGAARALGGWDQLVAEDTDISLRLRRAGWRLVFAPDALSLTSVPTSLGVLRRQRYRWDRSGFQTYFGKHRQLMRPSIGGWALATELWAEWLFSAAATALFPLYCAWLLWTSPVVLAFVALVSFALYAALSLTTLGAAAIVTPHLQAPQRLIVAALATPIYKEVLRWVRIRAFYEQLLRRPYRDGFLPTMAWAHRRGP